MTAASDRFFVITGGPGSGKSTLLQALAARGLTVVEEAGRAIIRDQLAIGGPALPWVDPAAFAEQMLALDVRAHRRAAARSAGAVMFDRGIPDVIGYRRLTRLPVPDHCTRAAQLLRYNRRVFLAPPWPAIFTQDDERKQTLEEAEATFHAMAKVYADFDYETVLLPRDTVEARVVFVLAAIAEGA